MQLQPYTTKITIQHAQRTSCSCFPCQLLNSKQAAFLDSSLVIAGGTRSIAGVGFELSTSNYTVDPNIAFLDKHIRSAQVLADSVVNYKW